MKFRKEYRYNLSAGYPKHIWICEGRHGAVHLHITDLGEDHARKYGDRYSAGLECHYRQPPRYMSDQAPSQKDCWVLGGPCWHDGTSLYAQESYVPFWQGDPSNHDRVLARLEREYADRFEQWEDDGPAVAIQAVRDDLAEIANTN